ncbi:transcription factor JunB-like isoform X1 [Gadus chalcogrammus]|uniref:transcription factor JunB-like isoform X1 n=2 Tax=Gadus chalcogrammus TaxID=1042646 RepID=UPI0024C28CD7|nr:transcription factor JunB-like isoform X1 [Gadus chalcogrammus]
MSALMEQPFYDDSFLSAFGRPGGAAAPPPDPKLPRQQNMTLDLCDPYHRSSSHLLKPHHLLRAAAADGDFYPSVHADVGSLKLCASNPDLERLILQNSTGTPTITSTSTPSGFTYSRSITEEQEGFADGFVKALDDLHKMNQMAPPPNVSIGGGTLGTHSGGVPASSVFGSSLQADHHHLEYTNLSNCTPNTANMSSSAPSYPSTTISYLPHHQYPHHHHHHQLPPQAHGSSHHFQHSLPGAGILHAQRYGGLMKEEPQTVPDLQSSDSGSPGPMSPIDMENQERIKAERKKLRNRLAATKCRRRKLERISRLEDKVKLLKNDNMGLSNTASLLRDQVAQLKQKVMTHVSNGCQLMMPPKVKSY